jgi:hypothetical protein
MRKLGQRKVRACKGVVLLYVYEDDYLRLNHVISHLIGHVRAGEWPKATTPCAPLEQGNVLVAYEMTSHENSNQKKKKKVTVKGYLIM